MASRKGQARLAKWEELAAQRGYVTLNGDLRHRAMLLKSKAVEAGEVDNSGLHSSRLMAARSRENPVRSAPQSEKL